MEIDRPTETQVPAEKGEGRVGEGEATKPLVTLTKRSAFAVSSFAWREFFSCKDHRACQVTSRRRIASDENQNDVRARMPPPYISDPALALI